MYFWINSNGIMWKSNTFLTEDPRNFKENCNSYILIWTIFCDPLHKIERCKMVHSVSQTSFGWGLISTCMFSEYFQTFPKWKKTVLIPYSKSSEAFLYSLIAVSWWILFLFVLLPRKSFKDLITEATFDEPLNLPSKLSVSPVF